MRLSGKKGFLLLAVFWQDGQSKTKPGRCTGSQLRSRIRMTNRGGTAMPYEPDRQIYEIISQSLGDRLKKSRQRIERIASKKTKSIDEIHHLRTETRRADAGLRLFEDWLPPHQTKRARKKLDSIRDCAGAVRDLD